MADDGLTRPTVRFFPVDLPPWRAGHLFRLAVVHPDTGREPCSEVMQADVETVRIPFVGEREPVVEIEWIE